MNFVQASVQEINMFLEERKKNYDQGNSFLSLLAEDKRKSVRNLAQKYISWLDKQEKEKERLVSLRRYENRLVAQGYQLIAGIDEAGRGPLAGPVVACAVVLPADCFLPGINDSKKISAKKREELAVLIEEQALAIGIGQAEVEEIDRINILQANFQAMQRAVAQLQIEPNYLLIDGNIAPHFALPYLPLVGGDSKSISIAAASIMAKVTRDKIMEQLDELYPQYGFAQHKGYGTAKHVQALAEHGVSPVHRLSFDLVRQYR